MKSKEFLSQLKKKFNTNDISAIAMEMGVSLQTIKKWDSTDITIEPFQIVNAMLKSNKVAVKNAQYHMIKPIVEFYPITKVLSKQEAKYELFSNQKPSENELKKCLLNSHGLYIYYDSRGHAIYAGKARKQSLWKEMNLAFNRPRDTQEITLVKHPIRNPKFIPAYEQLRQPTGTLLKLHEMAFYFSAFLVSDSVVDDLEALIVRGFANDLLNAKMEKFANSRS
jgi:hypothetical protein